MDPAYFVKYSSLLAFSQTEYPIPLSADMCFENCIIKSYYVGHPLFYCSVVTNTNGVFKGRRARHLPRPPRLGGPLEVLRV